MGCFDLIHLDLPIPYLQTLEDFDTLIEKGFIFMWAERGEIQVGYHLLNRWGFDVIDQIMWIKANEAEGKVNFEETV